MTDETRAPLPESGFTSVQCLRKALDDAGVHDASRADIIGYFCNALNNVAAGVPAKATSGGDAEVGGSADRAASSIPATDDVFQPPAAAPVTPRPARPVMSEGNLSGWSVYVTSLERYIDQLEQLYGAACLQLQARGDKSVALSAIQQRTPLDIDLAHMDASHVGQIKAHADLAAIGGNDIAIQPALLSKLCEWLLEPPYKAPLSATGTSKP